MNDVKKPLTGAEQTPPFFELEAESFDAPDTEQDAAGNAEMPDKIRQLKEIANRAGIPDVAKFLDVIENIADSFKEPSYFADAVQAAVHGMAKRQDDYGEFGRTILKAIRPDMATEEQNAVLHGMVQDRLHSGMDRATSPEVMTLLTFFNNYEETFDENGKPYLSGQARKALQSAFQAFKGLFEENPDLKEKDFGEAWQLYVSTKVPKINPQKTHCFLLPTDKVNQKLWGTPNGPNAPDGKFHLKVVTTPAKQPNHKPTAVYVSLDWDRLKELLPENIVSKVTPQDQKVHDAVGSLFDAGNEFTTMSQIYKCIKGWDRNPSSSDLESIWDSLYKMAYLPLFINGTEDDAAYKYEKFGTYQGTLLPIESVGAIVNGKYTPNAIHIMREPPLFTFARGRKQMTAVNFPVLGGHLGFGGANLVSYLERRIAHMKNDPETKRKILFKTVFAELGIADRQQKYRTKGKIVKQLEYYETKGWINGYRVQKEGVLILLDGKDAAPKKAVRNKAVLGAPEA